MQIICSRCGNNKRFYVPAWVRATFRFNEDDSVTLLHTRPLEAIEEKLVNGQVKCAMCRADVKLVMNGDDKQKEKLAMEAL